jgi:histidinol-phosphate aminotransferase
VASDLAREGAGDAHPGRLATAAVRGISPYVPGKPISELERELGLKDIVKLASNENPLGPSPGALTAMRRAVDEVFLYPDGSCHELKHALARHLSVPAECLALGNGSNELLLLLTEAFLTPDTSAVYSQYGFAIYALVVQETGARALIAPALGADTAMPYGHDLAAMARAIGPDTRMVFIANPNNPTGTWVEREPLRQFIAAAPPTTLIVLDEAYGEYAHELGVPDGLEWRERFPNLVILRTFSKAYGLAGARVGYAVSHPEVADVLNRLRPAFNVNSIAQAGAMAALADQAHMRRGVAATLAELRRVSAELTRLGIAQARSAANFLLVNVRTSGAAVYDELLRAGIIVRPMGGYGLPEHLRISIGLPAENDRLLRALPPLVGPARD